MTYDFDDIRQRRGTNSAKWDLAAEGEIPMWVADMDFPSPPEVVEALHVRVGHGIFGYPVLSEDYFSAFLGWEADALGFSIEREWVVHCSAVMPAVRAAIRCLTRPGEGVIVQPPVYYPFYSVVTEAGRQVVHNPLVETDGRYRMDLSGLERLIDDGNRVLLLCSPHNPVGRVWTSAELSVLSEVCTTRGVTVIADEIHCGLALGGHRFTSYASASAAAAGSCIVCHSPSKTFNLAGLPTSQIVVPDDALRRSFKDELKSMGHNSSGVLSLLAAQTAYSRGEPWRRELLEYLDGNRRWLAEFLRAEIPGVTMVPLEGTYIPWLDARGYLAERGQSDRELSRKIREEARVWLHAGATFGEEGAGFARINIACPRRTLTEAMNRVAEVLR